MKYLKSLAILLIVSSCGGGGGGGAVAIPFALTLGITSFSVNEDTNYSGSISATANEVVTLTYAITAQPSSGTISLSANGAISYAPNINFNGQDEFSYSVTATEKNVTKSSMVAITVTSVNDLPIISLTSKLNLDKDNLIFTETPSYDITFSDVDNDDSDLVFSAEIDGTDVPSTFTAGAAGSGSIELDLSGSTSAGLKNVKLKVSDGVDSSSDEFNTWFIANKRTVTITQDDDPSDGYDVGSSSEKDYYVYDLIGDTNSTAGTKWLIVADSIGNESHVERFRSALLRSINALNDSDASGFFVGYFDIVVVEPVTPDGSSPAAIKTGCYDWDETVYCIGSSDIDTSVFNDFLAEKDLISVLTMQSGRGVNLGNTNIQNIGARTEFTLMHELGHAHGEMGDEYLEKHGRNVANYSDRNVNTTTQSDPSQVKWKHWIDDLTNVSGVDYRVCYQQADGTFYDDPDNPSDDDITAVNCTCIVSDGVFPACSEKVGLHEGNYYSHEEDDTYDEFNFRPMFWTIMEGGRLEYGNVNAEGFAIGSIHNQGFYDAYPVFVDFVSDASSSNTGAEFFVDVDYDTSKLTLKWYVDGVEDASKENQKEVTFSRPSDNSVKVYSWKVFDLTNFIKAPDSVADNTDFYEGLFNTSFYWRDVDNSRWLYDPALADRANYNYGYMNGPMGGSWGFNWGKY